jgi:hypothetical protein
MLRTFCKPLALVAIVLTARGWAQESEVAARGEGALTSQPERVATSGMVSPTVEMWFYEQEQRRYDDPKLAVRRKAEARAQQRQARLAATRWYGISNSRPMVSPTPFTSGYSAYWGSNSYEPMRWLPAAPVIIVARPGDGPY